MINDRINHITDLLTERNLKFPSGLGLFDDPVNIRSKEEIAKRAVISAVLSRCAFDLYEAEDSQRIRERALETLCRFGLQEELFSDEETVLRGAADEDVCNTVAWQYEAAYTLLWALGLRDNIDDALVPEDIEAAIEDVFETVDHAASFDEFLTQCTLRDEDELADMYQVYWYYHWNVVDSHLFGTMLDSVNGDVVYERRRAIQWLVYADESENGDWNFSMDT